MSNTELEKFAQWFHQDFGVIFDDLETGANEYLNTLNEQQHKILSDEIIQLFLEYPGKDSHGIKNAWFRLGAQWWNKGIPEMLREISK